MSMETFVSICHKNRKFKYHDTDLWIKQLLFLYEFAYSNYEMSEDYEDGSDGIFMQKPLPGATYQQECSIILGLIRDGAIKLMNGDWPFDQGNPLEWIWGEFAHSALECEYDLSHNTRWISLLDPYDDEDSGEPDKGEALGHFDVGDAFGICQMFYPNAWTDKIIEYSKRHPMIFLRECEHLLSDALEDLAPPFPDEDTIQNAKFETKLKEVRRMLVKEPRFLYLMKCESTGLYKIGVSKNPKFREKTLQSEKPTISMVAKWANSSQLERGWHCYFKQQRVRGEWFKLSPPQVKFMCATMKSDPLEVASKISNKSASSA